MALKIKLYRANASDTLHHNCYRGREGDWTIEVFVPRDEQPTTADVEFEFEDDEETTEP